MRVKIIKCSQHTYWYSDQIECLFNVINSPTARNCYELQGEYSMNLSILKSDCEILPDEQPAQPEPFDLERALKGEKVILVENGKKLEVLEINQFVKHTDPYNICIVLGERISWANEHGGIAKRNSCLFMAPKEPEVVTRWVNVFINNNGELYTSSKVYDSEQENYTDAFVGSFPLTITLKPKP